MYFIIGVWGAERCLYAAIKFFLYTLAGSVIMLLAILGLYFNSAKLTGIETFNIPSLLASAQFFPDSLKPWLFWGFFFAFAIKVPMFPFHTWLPDAHTEAPTAGSVILAGVILKMGTYGFLRFSLPMLPQDPLVRGKIIHIVVVLSLISIIYGAVVCLMQKDMKRLIAYSSVGQMGLCTLGIFALTPHGLSGSVLQQINHGVVIGALFLIVSMLYERRHTHLISEFGGLAAPMPNLAAIYLIITLSSLGTPLLGGFIGEFSILQGTFEANRAWAAWATLGIVLGAAYLLWLYQRVMLGNVTHEANKTLRDLSLREYAVLIPLVLVTFWIGIYPKPFFAVIEKPVLNIIRQVNPSFFQDLSPAAERIPSQGPPDAAAAVQNASAPTEVK
jgi:NADH-quinone oxidoreductase subunit M